MAKILIIDDAALMRMMLRTILSRAGHEIVGEAENGTCGVEKFKELHPDLVTLDITMPGIDGIEALRQIRREDPNATCIMCSAMGQKAVILEAMHAGATDFIVKPFIPNHVVEAVNIALRKKN